MADTSNGFIYGLDELVFGGSTFGYISEEGLKPGGDKPSTTDIRAAQLQNAVVKSLLTGQGTMQFDFDLIQAKGANFKDAFGGTVDAQGVYTAPAKMEIKEGPATVKCFSGHTIVIPKANLTANLSGAISMSELLKISCTMKVLTPDGGASPFQIYPPGSNPPAG